MLGYLGDRKRRTHHGTTQDAGSHARPVTLRRARELSGWRPCSSVMPRRTATSAVHWMVPDSASACSGPVGGAGCAES